MIWAVDVGALGAAMLQNALRRGLNGADAIGDRAFMVHAKDDEAKDFYLKLRMEPCPPTLFIYFCCLRTFDGFCQLSPPRQNLSIRPELDKVLSGDIDLLSG